MLKKCKQWCESYHKHCEKWCGKFGWISSLVMRLAVGWVFLQAGWGKLHNLDRVTGFFTQLGIAMPGFMAPFVATTEFVCGLALIIGLWSRVAAIPLAITMIVALSTAHKESLQFDKIFGEAVFLYLVILIGIMGIGSG